jgi:flagellar biosynthesis/type III secretory pathway M-ring protein FliF/YscJ
MATKKKISVQDVENKAKQDLQEAEGWFSNLSTNQKWIVGIIAAIIIVVFLKACL